MKGRRGFTLIELLVVIAIIAILAAILFPVFARVRKTAMNSDCQSNMKQIGSAFKMYLGDWKDAYPVQYLKGAATTPPTTLVGLTRQTTPPQVVPGTGEPLRFEFGTNWVEALFPYMENISKDSAGAWKCNAAPDSADDTGGLTASTTARVNYAMNINLVGQPEGIIKTASNMLLVRETDRKVNSILRPINVSAAAPTPVPIAPFLSTTDAGYKGTNSLPPCQPKQHGNGSNMLFADGHVKGFSSDALPKSPVYDPGDAQWYNAIGAPAPKLMWKAIAVSP